MIDLQRNEVAIVPRESWSSVNLASLLEPMPTQFNRTFISPLLNSGQHGRGAAISQHEILAPVVEWIRSWSPDLAPLLNGASAEGGISGFPGGRPKDLAMINLEEKSLFYGLKGRRYFGTQPDIEETNRHHHDGIQEYRFGPSALGSDAVISVTALQTHGTAGISAGLHGVVGSSTDRNWLPHHSIGTPKTGGDSFPDSSFRSRLDSAFLAAPRPARRLLRHLGRQKTSRPGAWWGNDTLWRTILDLNRALLYARADGSLAESTQRQTFSIVEVEGPTRLVIAGPSITAVDLVCARIMGFDWKRIPHLSHVFDDHELPIVDFCYDDIVVRSQIGAFDRRLVEIERDQCMRFQSPIGWAGWLEARDE